MRPYWSLEVSFWCDSFQPTTCICPLCPSSVWFMDKLEGAAKPFTLPSFPASSFSPEIKLELAFWSSLLFMNLPLALWEGHRRRRMRCNPGPCSIQCISAVCCSVSQSERNKWFYVVRKALAFPIRKLLGHPLGIVECYPSTMCNSMLRLLNQP